MEKKENIINFPGKLEGFIKVKTAGESSKIMSNAKFLSRPQQASPSGTRLNGVELARITPLLAGVPEELRKSILGHFQIATKYQVLNTLVSHPRCELRTNHLPIAVKVARIATESDRFKEQLQKEMGY